QRLSVEVEEREGDQVGETVLRGADDLDVGQRSHARADAVDEPVLACVDLVTLGQDGPQRCRSSKGSGHVLETAGPFVPTVIGRKRVAPSRALAYEEQTGSGRAAPLVGGGSRSG